VIELVPGPPTDWLTGVQTTHQGRFEVEQPQNFNRDFFDLAAAITALEGCLNGDAPAIAAAVQL
jgi:hypothetical protein